MRRTARLSRLVLPMLVTAAAAVALIQSPADAAVPAPKPHGPHVSTADGESLAISLVPSSHTVAIGSQVTMTATTTQDVGPTPYDIEIYDTTQGTLIAICGGGTSCSGTASEATDTTDQFVAYVAVASDTAPPPEVQATSLTNFVTWSNSGLIMSLYTTSNDGVHWQYNAVVNQDVGNLPYYIQLYYGDGTFLTRCGSGTSCTYAATLGNLEQHQVVAFVSPYGYQLPPFNAQSSSNTASVINANIFG